MQGTSCFICNVDSGCSELTCKRCKFSIHYKCGLGFDPPEEFKLSDSKADFLCATCLVGTDYDLIHRALEAHKKCQVPVISEAGSPTTPSSPTAPTTPRRPDHAMAPSDQSREAGSDPLQDAETFNLPDTSMAPPHSDCMVKSKAMLYRLGTLRRVPPHANTFIGGDSNLTAMDGKDVDPIDDQVRIRSVGGICITGTVIALLKFQSVLKSFRKVVWVLGTNDELHKQNHCLDDNGKYLKLLYQESKRIFPNASISIITPFLGIKGISQMYTDNLVSAIKFSAPKLRWIKPPSVKDKISKKGVHLSKEGRVVFVNFLRSKLIRPKQRTFSSDSGRPSVVRSATSVPPVTPQVAPRLQHVDKDQPPSRQSTEETSSDLRATFIPATPQPYCPPYAREDIYYRHLPLRAPPWYGEQVLPNLQGPVANELLRQQQQQMFINHNNYPSVGLQPWRPQFIY